MTKKLEIISIFSNSCFRQSFKIFTHQKLNYKLEVARRDQRVKIK